MSTRVWLLLALPLAMLTTVGCASPPSAATEIVSFEVTANRIARGDSVRLSWLVRNVGSHPDASSCSVSRRFEGADGGSPFEVSCEGAFEEVPEPPPGAGYVRYQLNALKRPFDAASPYVTRVVTVTFVGAEVAVAPASVSMPVNGVRTFTATVSGIDDTRIGWGASCGSVSGSGDTITYTAPAHEGTCTVTATSVADPSASGSASVDVTANDAFETAPSYVGIANVGLLPASGGTREVRFDLSWDESWRGASRPSWVTASNTWDAAWLFVKYRVDGGAWQHATLASGGHMVPTSAVLDVPSDGTGAFVYRASPGYGTFALSGVVLAWDHVADGVAASANVDVVLFGIEMVYVPQGSFSLGSGGGSTGEFRAGGTSGSPFVVSSQTAIALGDTAGQLTWTATSTSGSPSGTTNASYPTGFAAFYLMKREVTQGQYVDFLNTLTQLQADARRPTVAAGTARYAITGASVGGLVTDLPFVAMNFVSWADGAAFADWAGLRPMTELEFEKASRGPTIAVPNEYAWGSTIITQATGLANPGTLLETPTPEGANANYWDGGNPIAGPVRAGSFARPGAVRRDAGAGYYGAVDLSGNVWERAVTIGNEAGRAFTGTHGDGTLTTDGDANVASWPNASALGAGLRGGGWQNLVRLEVSYRSIAADVDADRSATLGWRGARSAP